MGFFFFEATKINVFFLCPELGSLLSQVFFHWGEGMSLLLLNKYFLLVSTYLFVRCNNHKCVKTPL